MALNGQITRTDDDAFTGHIAALTFDVDITLAPNPYKTKDTHPDFEITATSPKNRVIRIGSAWEQKSKKGNAYLSLAISINGQEVRVNALEDKTEPGTYRLVALSS